METMPLHFSLKFWHLAHRYGFFPAGIQIQDEIQASKTLSISIDQSAQPVSARGKSIVVHSIKSLNRLSSLKCQLSFCYIKHSGGSIMQCTRASNRLYPSTSNLALINNKSGSTTSTLSTSLRPQPFNNKRCTV